MLGAERSLPQWLRASNYRVADVDYSGPCVSSGNTPKRDVSTGQTEAWARRVSARRASRGLGVARAAVEADGATFLDRVTNEQRPPLVSVRLPGVGGTLWEVGKITGKRAGNYPLGPLLSV